MKLKHVFKLIGLTLFFVALMVFLYVQQKNSVHDQLTIAMLICFGSLLAFSAASLVTGELLGRIETLETKVFWLEEELKKQKREKEE